MMLWSLQASITPLTKQGEHSRSRHYVPSYAVPIMSYYRWSFLEIRDTRKDVGKENTSDEEIAYLAGKMEGILTASLMEMQWENTMKTYCTDNSQLCKKITEFLMENHEYATVKDDTSTDPRWYQVTGIPLLYKGLSC